MLICPNCRSLILPDQTLELCMPRGVLPPAGEICPECGACIGPGAWDRDDDNDQEAPADYQYKYGADF